MIEKNKIYNMDCNIGMESIPDNSIDIIFTDPPYIKNQWLQAYTALATHAPRILKPSGWLVCYSGHENLNKVIRMFDDAGLLWYWIDCQLNSGATAMVFHKKVIAGWKPILIYQKAPFKTCERGFCDVIRSEVQKDLHEWQQSLDDAFYILSRFTKHGQTLVEPFLGSGTTISAAKSLGLEWYAFEKDPNTYRIAKARQIQESILDEW